MPYQEIDGTGSKALDARYIKELKPLAGDIYQANPTMFEQAVLLAHRTMIALFDRGFLEYDPTRPNGDAPDWNDEGLLFAEHFDFEGEPPDALEYACFMAASIVRTYPFTAVDIFTNNLTPF